MNKKILVTTVAISILGAGMITSSSVFAQTTQTSDNQRNTLVQKIADKFNLNKSDIQAVFDQERSEHIAMRQTRSKEILDQLVKDGKITAAQEKLILDKRAEMEANRETEMQNMKNLTREERKAQMDKKRVELEAWAKEKGIDAKYLMPRGGMRGGHKMGGPMNGQTTQQ